jgi:hypothetical protein
MAPGRYQRGSVRLHGLFEPQCGEAEPISARFRGVLGRANPRGHANFERQRAVIVPVCPHF